MKKINYIFVILFVSVMFASCGKKALTDEFGCYFNYDDAVELAGKKKQPMLVLFTSEGDDDLSNQYVNGILKDSSFQKNIVSKYSVLHADFSQKAFEKSNADGNATEAEKELANTYTNIIQNNYNLAILFNIIEMPAAFLCTPEGYVVCRLDENRSFSTISELETAIAENLTSLERINNLVAETKKGNYLNKVDAVDAVFVATDPAYRSFLMPLINYALALDPNNDSGLCGQFILSIAESKAIMAYAQGDVEAAIEAYLVAADNSYLKAEQKQECLYTAAYIVTASGSDDNEGILEYLKLAYQFAPESIKAPAIQSAIDYFTTLVESDSEIDAE